MLDNVLNDPKVYDTVCDYSVLTAPHVISLIDSAALNPFPDGFTDG